MVKEFEKLLLLQDIDVNIDSINAFLAELTKNEDLAEINRELKELNLAKNQLLEKLSALRIAIKELDARGIESENKIHRLTEKLYNEKDHGIKELQAMQSEVDHQQELKNVIDDQEIELLMEVESIENKLNIIQESISLSEEKLAQNLKSTEAQLSTAKLKLDDLATKRSELLDNLNSEYLEIYSNLRAHGMQIAIARLINNKCMGCSVDIAVHEADLIRRSSEVINYCEQCGCMLVVE